MLFGKFPIPKYRRFYANEKARSARIKSASPPIPSAGRRVPVRGLTGGMSCGFAAGG